MACDKVNLQIKTSGLWKLLPPSTFCTISDALEAPI